MRKVTAALDEHREIIAVEGEHAEIDLAADGEPSVGGSSVEGQAVCVDIEDLADFSAVHTNRELLHKALGNRQQLGDGLEVIKARR